MLRPRWRKVFSDLWSNKTRSLLVVASIAVGLFAIGIITTNQAIIGADMEAGYAAVQPANIIITSDPFDQDLVDRIRHLDGVLDAEGVRKFTMRLKTGPDDYITIDITAIPDFDKMTINKVHLEQGSWPPARREIAIERNKLADTKASVGGTVELELPDGRTRTLNVVGVVNDQTVGVSTIGGGFFLAPAQGYISTETLDSLGMDDTFNTMYARVTGNSDDEDHIKSIADTVRSEMQSADRKIVNVLARRTDEHPNSPYVDAISGVLLFLGLMIVFLSGFLITNTLQALLNQQVRQIGVMKTVGARRAQVITLYMALILVFGLLAFAIALPLSNMASNPLVQFLAQRINFRVQGFRVIPATVMLQLAISLVVPQLAAFFPILHGSRISVQEALSGLGESGGAGREGRFNRWLLSIKRLPRPMLISLRNTFRLKSRLALTLITLSMGGAIFIATFNVRLSLAQYVQQVSHYFLADVNLTLDRPYRIDRIQSELMNVPGVQRVEGWGAVRSELILEDDSVGDSVNLLAPPVNSPLIEPILFAGRWLQPGDENAIVLSERFLSRFPDLKPGGTIRLRVNGKETDWEVVGFFQLAGKSGGFLAYAPYDYLSKLVNQPGKAITYRIVSTQTGLSLDEQDALGRRIEAQLRADDYRVSDITAGLFLSESAAKGLNVLTTFLLIMAGLTALVGSIGLAGTMSLNVMERTREIGVMRAIGASDGILMRMVIVEGLIIGLISWIFGSLLAFPISEFMSYTLSMAVFDFPVHFSFTWTGFALWLGIVVLLSVVSSLLPARSAARLTIREVLAYE